MSLFCSGDSQFHSESALQILTYIYFQAETCAKRKLICKYCDIDKPADGMEEHENYCGSRTEKCNDCGERIMMKNWDIHMNSNHGFIKLNDGLS